MNSAALCAVMLTVALDYGYEPMQDGGIEYVIQIEPHLLDALRNGEPMGSDIEPAVQGRIRAFRILSNDQLLSKVIPPPGGPELPTDEPPVSSPEPTLPPSAAPPLSDVPPRQLPHSADVIPTSAEVPTEPLDGPSGREDPPETERPTEPDSKPWFPLILLTVVAAGSSSGMCYFGWLALDYRSRYLGLLRETMNSGNSWLDDPVYGAQSDDSAFDRPTGDQPKTDAAPAEDSAWSDLGKDSRDSLGDWLEGDDESKTHRNRKKSR